MILIDTNILIELERAKNEKLLQKVFNLGFDNICINSIVAMEFIQGAKNRNNLNKISKIIKDIEIVELTPNISILARELIIKYKLSFNNFEMADSLIASTAIINNLSLLTLNKKDFKFIEGLNLL